MTFGCIVVVWCGHTHCTFVKSRLQQQQQQQQQQQASIPRALCLASLGPFLGAPAGSPGQVKYTGGTGSGAWHPLTPSWVPSVVCRTTVHGRCGGGSACAYCWGTDRGMPVPQILLVCGGGVLPLVQLLDKVADLPVASMTGA